jgi:hypothetical protein
LNDPAPPTCPGFSEFEIYGLFVERILNKKITCPPYNIYNCDPNVFVKWYPYYKNKDVLLGGVDNDLPQEFWQAQGITFQKII